MEAGGAGAKSARLSQTPAPRGRGRGRTGPTCRCGSRPRRCAAGPSTSKRSIRGRGRRARPRRCSPRPNVPRLVPIFLILAAMIARSRRLRAAQRARRPGRPPRRAPVVGLRLRGDGRVVVLRRASRRDAVGDRTPADRAVVGAADGVALLDWVPRGRTVPPAPLARGAGHMGAPPRGRISRPAGRPRCADWLRRRMSPGAVGHRRAAAAGVARVDAGRRARRFPRRRVRRPGGGSAPRLALRPERDGRSRRRIPPAPAPSRAEVPASGDRRVRGQHRRSRRGQRLRISGSRLSPTWF